MLEEVAVNLHALSVVPYARLRHSEQCQKEGHFVTKGEHLWSSPAPLLGWWGLSLDQTVVFYDVARCEKVCCWRGPAPLGGGAGTDWPPARSFFF